jgi:hypothetical protein
MLMIGTRAHSDHARITVSRRSVDQDWPPSAGRIARAST